MKSAKMSTTCSRAQRRRSCSPWSAACAVAALFAVCIAGPSLATICIVVDAGGTAVMPPQCTSGYLSPEQVHMIIDGLPPGTQINIDASHERFFPTNSGPGGSLGGEFEQFNSEVRMNMQGQGIAINRMVTMQVQCETHIGPRTPGTPIQSFDTDMFMLQGQLPNGDPDFDLLRITAGTGFGMPSPGHTTLTRQPGGWAVDSFFDIFYRIDFIGAPGGPLSGMSGSTTGTIRMQMGQPVTPIFCRCKGDMDASAIVDLVDVPSFVNELLLPAGDLCADVNSDLLVNGRDISPMVTKILAGTACAALDAWETPPSTGIAATSSFYVFGTGDQPPIPADFFGPGSDPFVGTVMFDGLPIDATSMAGTDTIIRRGPMPFPPMPPVVPIPIELVELSLVSANPITVSYGGIGTEQWMVTTAISDTPAGGTMQVQEVAPGYGGTFTATVPVRPVFAFVNMQDLAGLDAGLITEDQVRTMIIDTGDQGSPLNPLQINFGGQQSPWIRQACGPQLLQDGLFFFHNPGDGGFIPGVQGPLPPEEPCGEQFKPGPMKHVKPGEAHYIKPPNATPGGNPLIRCKYGLIGRRAFCRSGKVGTCPPAPQVICTRPCSVVPCSPFLIRIVRIACKSAAGTANRGWCFQFYRLGLPPFDCGTCP